MPLAACPRQGVTDAEIAIPVSLSVAVGGRTGTRANFGHSGTASTRSFDVDVPFMQFGRVRR